jgi:hypothetical protein
MQYGAGNTHVRGTWNMVQTTHMSEAMEYGAHNTHVQGTWNVVHTKHMYEAHGIWCRQHTLPHAR